MDDTMTGVATKATPVVGPEPAPALATGAELLGELQHSGYKEPPYLARRADGQTIQLTELLYRVLEAIDGRRDMASLAGCVSERIGKKASPDDIRFLVDEKLRPLGLLKRSDGSDPEVKKANPLLALRFRFVLSDERTTRLVTAPFARLFAWPIAVAVIFGFAAMLGWLLFDEGIAGGARAALYRPSFLVLVFVLACASAGFHEFGHAAALRRGGGQPGAMGAGLYLVWPAFYTDVTDSYRLPRRDRLRTDLGGLYFNMVFALGIFGVWAVTGADALLLVIPLLVLQMVQQLLPFVRLDGYHILADLTGVPDLFGRIKPTLASLKPGADVDARVTALKPWVRGVITAWMVAVIPLLLLSLAFAVVTLPRAAATAWDSFGLQRQSLSTAWARGDAMGTTAGVLAVLALALPVLSTCYLVGRLGNRGGRAMWRRTDGHPVLRLTAGLALLGLAGSAAFVLWPNGEYRPYQPSERGRVQETIASLHRVHTGRPSLTVEQQAALDGAPFQSATTTTVPSGETSPTDTVVTDPAASTESTTTTSPPAADSFTSPEPVSSTTTTSVADSSTTSTTTSVSSTSTTTTTSSMEPTQP